MAASVRIEQGAMIMPCVRNEPEAMRAPTSSMAWLCETLARKRVEGLRAHFFGQRPLRRL